jgi:signal transduction histidine kinase
MDNVMDPLLGLFGMSFGITVAIAVIAYIMSWLLNILGMMIGAKIADIDNRSFGKAFIATLLIVCLGGFVLSVLAVIHPILAVLGFFLIPVFFVQWAYSCSFGKAAIAYIINIFACTFLFIAFVMAIVFGLGITIDSLRQYRGDSENRSEQQVKVDKSQSSGKAEIVQKKSGNDENGGQEKSQNATN